MNKSSTWELWQRFSCHPWTDEQKLYVGTLAKIFLPSLDWRTKTLHGSFGKDFPAILGLTNKSSTWELWQRFSCHPWTDEQKLYVGTLAKDFPAILGLTNKSSTLELWQRFSCHPWTDEQKLYVGTLAKIFLPSLDWWTKALLGNFGKRFSCHPWTDKQKLYIGTLAKIFLPSLDWQTKALRGNFGKDFPAILGLTNKSSTWELWQRFSCHPWTDEQKLYVGTLAKIFLPSLDWGTKALCGNFGKDFPAILRLTNKSSMWKHWQRFSYHPWTDEWQRFSCHPWTVEQKLYVRTLAKIFLPSLDWGTKALCGNFGKDFPAILGLRNKSSMWELWQRFSCHPWTDEQKLYVETLAKIFVPSWDCRTKALSWNIGKDFPAILGLSNGKDFPAILGLSNKSSM